MPYFPKDGESFTLTLNDGSTVTLKERRLSQGERKNLRKRMLATQFDFRFKTKQGEDIDKRFEEAGLNREEFDKVAEDAVVLFDSAADALNLVYASVLAARFCEWDVYATREDLEANRPVELDRDAIIAFIESDPLNVVMLEDLMAKLRERDGVEEKKEQSAPAPGGSSSTVKADSSEKHQTAY